MKPVVRNVLAVVAGLAVCMFVNGGIIAVSGSIIPPPEGVNPKDMESVRAHAHLFQPRHFIMPFLAHALGSLLGGLVAAGIAGSRKRAFAMAIGVVHLLGGIAAVIMIPAPVWFEALDLLVAYLPMAWLGGRLGSRTASPQVAPKPTG